MLKYRFYLRDTRIFSPVLVCFSSKWSEILDLGPACASSKGRALTGTAALKTSSAACLSSARPTLELMHCPRMSLVSICSAGAEHRDVVVAFFRINFSYLAARMARKLRIGRSSRQKRDAGFVAASLRLGSKKQPMKSAGAVIICAGPRVPPIRTVFGVTI